MEDKGSPIAQFWFDIVRYPHETWQAICPETAFKTNLLTRLTVGIFYGLALIPLICIGTFRGWLIGALFVVCNTIIWGALVKNEGMIGKFLVEEFLIGAGIGLGAFLAVI